MGVVLSPIDESGSAMGLPFYLLLLCVQCIHRSRPGCSHNRLLHAAKKKKKKERVY